VESELSEDTDDELELEKEGSGLVKVVVAVVLGAEFMG
jgi:hypothetical protein